MSFLLTLVPYSPHLSLIKTLASFSPSNPINLPINKIVFLIIYPHFEYSKCHYQPLNTIPFIVYLAYTNPYNHYQVQNPTLTFIFHTIGSFSSPLVNLQNVTLDLHLHSFPRKFSPCISKPSFIWIFSRFHNILKHLKIQKTLISCTPTS